MDIRLDPAHPEATAPDLARGAGMPAEVSIAAQPRTLAQYLTVPLRRSFERALTES